MDQGKELKEDMRNSANGLKIVPVGTSDRARVKNPKLMNFSECFLN